MKLNPGQVSAYGQQTDGYHTDCSTTRLNSSKMHKGEDTKYFPQKIRERPL